MHVCRLREKNELVTSHAFNWQELFGMGKLRSTGAGLSQCRVEVVQQVAS